ncbi:MAG: [NiFe]-hydrogenase assembly chaperone HybE [Rhodobacteraceae bacterium]|jgi:[NiFe] hydrogenase assembly HybE family chaperone|nr:[NiFe]-hydrogenase assembly chaperone HybE [Paracoccaceae bacterium]
MTEHPRVAALVDAFRAADAAMRDLPLYNPALAVEAWGFRPLAAEGLAGVLISPWFMNLVLLPLVAEPIEPARWGQARRVELPAGEQTFRYAGDTGLGAIWTASLHSPMEVFRSQAQARAEARLRLQSALTPPAPDAEGPDCPARRSFLGARPRGA